MTKNEFLDIANKEGLKNYNLYNENNLRPDELEKYLPDDYKAKVIHQKGE